MNIAHEITTETHRTSDVFNNNNIGHDFDSFLLTPNVLAGLKECGFVHPSPIQVEAIPLAKCGVDLVCQAKSGTGKTCVLAICTLETIDVNNDVIQALILAPTREVAHQIHGVVTSIGCFIGKLQCGLFIGGLAMDKDIERLKHCHVAIATPGRLKCLIEKGHFSTQSIRLFILDEADKLLEKGSFQEQINWIYSTLPKDKQMLALSATYPESLASHLNNYMKDPIHVRINPKDVALKGVLQFYKTVKHHPLPNKLCDAKYKVLIEILQKLPFQQCMVFSNLHSRAENLSRKLINEGWPTTFIAGTQVQKDRLKAIEKLKKFHCRVLITTDLTSRGIDCDKVNLVINLDLPWDRETYLHRVGRAGRFGSHGVGISLVSEVKEKQTFFEMTKMMNRKPRALPDADKLPSLWNDVALYQEDYQESESSDKWRSDYENEIEGGSDISQKEEKEDESKYDVTDAQEDVENSKCVLKEKEYRSNNLDKEINEKTSNDSDNQVNYTNDFIQLDNRDMKDVGSTREQVSGVLKRDNNSSKFHQQDPIADKSKRRMSKKRNDKQKHKIPYPEKENYDERQQKSYMETKDVSNNDDNTSRCEFREKQSGKFNENEYLINNLNTAARESRKDFTDEKYESITYSGSSEESSDDDDTTSSFNHQVFVEKYYRAFYEQQQYLRNYNYSFSPTMYR